MASIKTLAPPLTHKGVSTCSMGFAMEPGVASSYLVRRHSFLSFLLPTPLISIWPQRLTESLRSMHRGRHPSTNCLPLPPGSYTLFCTCPSPTLKPPSQLTTHLMLSYPQLRRIITSFLRPLQDHPSEKPNSQHPPVMFYPSPCLFPAEHSPQSENALLIHLTFVSSVHLSVECLLHGGRDLL